MGKCIDDFPKSSINKENICWMIVYMFAAII